MPMNFTELLANPVFGIVLFLAINLTIALINSFALTPLHRYPTASEDMSQQALPFVSVLVPARNEEGNIETCVRSLLDQDYAHFEVLVLNDHSTDRTAEILERLAAQDERLQVLQGQSLPEGWLGKNWACHQLANAAQGEAILFVDADTMHQPGMVSHSIRALLDENVDMLTALPRQVVRTWGERLIVPIIYFSLLVFLPLPLAYRLRLPVFSAAIGQFMLFKRQAYEQIGGYAAVRAHGTDDLALARQVKNHTLPWRLADGGELVSTRMYRNFQQAFEGFSKNLFAAFDYRLLPFLFAWLWMGYLFFRPPLELVLRLSFSPDQVQIIWLCAIAILEALLLWMLTTWRFRFPGYLFLVYPAIIFMSVWIALRSVYLSLRGKSTWKGRTLERQKIHWI